MNTYTLSLSSDSTSLIRHIDPVVFNDFTKLTIDLNDIDEKTPPIFVKIDWGVGDDVMTYDNDLYVEGRRNNLITYSKVLRDTYTFNYYPSTYALYKSLSAQVLVEYVNGDQSWFVIPIEIRTYDYLESFHDLKIINTNILPLSGNPVEYQLRADKDNQIIELIS